MEGIWLTNDIKNAVKSGGSWVNSVKQAVMMWVRDLDAKIWRLTIILLNKFREEIVAEYSCGLVVKVNISKEVINNNRCK